MKHFLEIVASGYAERYQDLSRLTFVMPNKRSGFFLLRYFQKLFDVPHLAPGIISISDFIDRSISTVADSRLDLLFRLFESYGRVQGHASEMPFEKFWSWGETILSDFNEIDMHMVDPDEIFKNVADLNYIRTNFLSESQKRVIAEYFGYSPDEMFKETERFWREFDNPDAESDSPEDVRASRRKFYTLWQLLPGIYRDFKKHLAEDGFTTEGGAYREAAERMENGFEPFPGEKLVFVGFNALAESERRIFQCLKDMEVEIDGRIEQKADFVWDLISSRIVDDHDPAVRFVRFNSRSDNFPSPDWLVPSLNLNMAHHSPKIEVVAVPSGMMQVKVVSEILDQWKKSERERPSSESEDKIVDSNIAVVLPDERLLLPLLHSLPEEYSEPNLTMGFPLKHTPVISFASLLRKMHAHGRHSGNEDYFLLEDVRDLLSHPYSHVLFRSGEISNVVKDAENHKLVVVSSSFLDELGKNSKLVFRHFGETAGSGEVLEYLKAVFSEVKDNLYESGSYLNSNLEKVYLSTYCDALQRLANCLKENRLPLNPQTIFTLADRLMAGETVSFQGHPVKGLQVMGMLETRCLDFDRVVMLSVNEKVIPRVGRNSTFIPNVIRVAFGMPPAHYQEEIFAYYFFRLLGRCNHGLLTYDSRSSDSRTPGASRYLLQMKYLPGAFSYTEREARFEMPKKFESKLEISKDGAIDGKLKLFESEYSAPEEKPKNFSASALSNYMGCPLKFLYQTVLELYVDQEKIETINAIDLGTIIHSTIECLYLPDETERKKLLKAPKVMTYNGLKALLDRKTPQGTSLIEEVAKRNILITHFKTQKDKLSKARLHGSAVFLLDYIVEYVKNIIRADMKQAPFRLWGTEIEETVSFPLSDGRKVNVKMVIDRLDQQGAEGVSEPFRIVDYKSGSVHLEAETFEEIFDGTFGAHNIFQLFLYAELLVFMIQNDKLKLPDGFDRENFANGLKIAIYSVLQLPDAEGIRLPKVGGEEIDGIATLRRYESENEVSFLDRFDRLLREILNRNVPFASETSDRDCSYCDYRLRCECLAAMRPVSDTVQTDVEGVSGPDKF